MSLIRFAIFAGFLGVIGVFFLGAASAQPPPESEMFENRDLGLWLSYEGRVRVWVVDSFLVAVFENPQECPLGGTRGHYLIGQLTGKNFPLKLTGQMMRCMRDEELLKQCKLESVWEADLFEATVEKDRIYGKYEGEFYSRDENGKFNCTPEQRMYNFTIFRRAKLQWLTDPLRDMANTGRGQLKSIKDKFSDLWDKEIVEPAEKASDNLFHDIFDPGYHRRK